jgi:hypothetical protein
VDVQELRAKLNELRSASDETEWVEFKANYKEPDQIGEYISALANGAALVREGSGLPRMGNRR